MASGDPPEDPKLDEAWVDDAGELRYWNGSTWVLYEEPPELPGGDRKPQWVERDY